MRKSLKTMVLMVFFSGLFVACDKLSTTNHQLSANLVHNGDFEQGVSTPDGWHTHNQFLDDVTGWATDEVYSGKHSLKIENIDSSDAFWQGEPIVFDTPTQVFSASVWALAKEVKGNNEACKLAFDVVLKENDAKKRVFVSIPTTKLGWQQVSQKFHFSSDIKMIIPNLMFSGSLGTVWFDDLNVNAIQIDWDKAKTLFDTNKGGTFTGQVEKGEGNSFVFKGKQAVFSTDFIPIDSNKVYKLSGEFKALGNQKDHFYFGFSPYTKDKEFISAPSINYYDGTNTELIKACNANDKVIIVKDASHWYTTSIPYAYVAFNADDLYKDIPNFKLSNIANIEKFDKFWKISLSEQVGCDYPAGTKIREHFTTNMYIYSAADGVLAPDKGTSYQSISTGESVLSDGFRKGTKFVKILILANYDAGKDSVLSLRNVKLVESSIGN